MRATLSPPLLLAALAVWAAACFWYPLTDTDIWWHLASAKLMWAQKGFLRQDPFSLSSLGTPWIDLHWGFQSLAYLAWKAGGAHALVAAKCLALAGAVGFALRPHLDRRTVYWLVPMAAFGLYHVRFHIDARPLVLTMLGLGIQYAALMGYFRGALNRPWWILVPVQAALVNIQGLYPLGALSVTCLVAGEWAARARPGTGKGMGFAPAYPRREPRPLRPLVWTCVAMWMAGLISPYGWSGFVLPLSLFGRIAPVDSNIFSTEIAENLPLPDLFRADPGAVLPFLFLALAILYTFLRAGSRISLGHALLFASFAALGWMAQRNLPLALLAGLMAAGRNLQVYLEGTREARIPGSAALIAVAALYGPAIFRAWEYELPGSMETPFRFPSRAVDYLEENPVPGNIFNELRYGGYLEFRLHPDKLAFVDGRMILRSAGFYREFLSAVDRPRQFEAYRRKHGFTHALLPISEDKRFLPLAAHLAGEGGWALLFCDGASALLAAPPARGMDLDSVPPGHPLRETLRERFSANPRLESIALANAAEFLRLAGRRNASEELRKISVRRP